MLGEGKTKSFPNIKLVTRKKLCGEEAGGWGPRLPPPTTSTRGNTWSCNMGVGARPSASHPMLITGLGITGIRVGEHVTCVEISDIM